MSWNPLIELGLAVQTNGTTSYSHHMPEAYRLLDKHFSIRNTNQFPEDGYDAFTENNRKADLLEYIKFSLKDVCFHGAE